jgi:hypothetical protein
MIELSLVLPFWKAKNIGWLPLESFVRQVGIEFEWELIVAEENINNYLGEGFFMGYKKQLEKVGCVNLKYIKLNKWVPLGEKLFILRNNCSDVSKIFTWTAADCYYSPRSLSTQYNAFSENDIHWFLTEKTPYYDIKTKKWILDDKSIVKRKDDCMEKSYLMELVRKFSDTKFKKKRSGLDGFFHSQLIKLVGGSKKLKTYVDKGDNWKYRFSTNGMNTITLFRKKYFKKLCDSFCICPVDVEKNIPKDIMKKLKAKELIKLAK